MESKIGVGVNLLIGKRSKRTGARGQRRRVAVGATDRDELVGAPRHGAVDGTARRWGQKPHEISEVVDVVEHRGIGESSDVEQVVWRRLW